MDFAACGLDMDGFSVLWFRHGWILCFVVYAWMDFVFCGLGMDGFCVLWFTHGWILHKL